MKQNDTNIQNILEKAKLLNHEIEIISDIKSGKEAVVYSVLLNGELIALKLYKNPEERSFKNTNQYLLGKYYKNTSHRKAIEKGNKFSKKLKHENWVKREFFMLEKLYALGAKIPKPILHIENGIFMELLGDTETVAPRLSDLELTKTQAKKAFNKIIESMQIFWDFGIVHADLSQYNILWWKDEPYIIDFPQSINKKTHPNASELLERDLKNISNYFGKYIEIDVLEIKDFFA